METERIDALVGEYLSFDDILDAVFGRLEEKQANIFLQRIYGLEKTLSELEESLIALRNARGEEKTR
jgi:hypothetical protein